MGIFDEFPVTVNTTAGFFPDKIFQKHNFQLGAKIKTNEAGGLRKAIECLLFLFLHCT
jgi:hypothetical protein